MFWAHAISRRDVSPADGIHLLWAPLRPAGYSVKGYDIWRRKSRGKQKIDCYTLTGSETDSVNSFIPVTTRLGVVSARLGTMPELMHEMPNEPLERKRPHCPGFNLDPKTGARLAEWRRPKIALPEALLRKVLRKVPELRLALAQPPAGRPSLSTPPTQQAWVYQFDFGRPCNVALAALSVKWGLAIAFREGKAVDAKPLTGGPPAEAMFRGRGVDRILIYTASAAKLIRLCCELTPDEKQEAKDWQGAKQIAKGLQLPFQAFSSAVGAVAEEADLAKSRVLAGEDLGNGDFKEMSDIANRVGALVGRAAANFVSLLERDKPEDIFLDLSAWDFVTLLAVHAPWRRALAFGFLDEGDELQAAESYDYRITGYFRRRDLEERFLGFHTVPIETVLPSAFHLGDVRLFSDPPTAVEPWPKIPAGALRHVCRKGIPIRGRLVLQFTEPVDRVVLELEPSAGNNLQYHARPSAFFFGPPGAVMSGPVPAEQRVEFAFDHPVDKIELRGRGFLYGIRRTAIPAGENPDLIVARSVVLYDVVYEATQAPESPPFLGTVNLQEPDLPVADPMSRPAPPHSLGFRLHWLPPPPSPAFPAGVWPPDLDAVPPTNVVGYQIERRRVDKPSPFKPIDPDDGFKGTTLLGGNRGRSEAAPEPLGYGADLLQLFPAVTRPSAPVDILMDLDDVLTSPAKPDGPPPGSTHRYRIFSIDIIGRRSNNATPGSVVRLEKRLPPPMPRGVPQAVDPDRTLPKGVHARVIQASEPNLSAADIHKLAGHQSAVVLRWGWTDRERMRDPLAHEFRVYWMASPADALSVELVGSTVLSGGLFRIAARFPRPIAANEFRGRAIQAGGFPFFIDHHDAGADVDLYLETPATEPAAVPEAGAAKVLANLAGEEQRPSAWDQRVAVHPITAAESYEHVFHDLVLPTATVPRVRAWAGVSAADDQAYIPDEVPAGDPNGDRKGNESAVVIAAVEARYRGRPDFQVPPPLPDVPEIVLPEVEGEMVAHVIDLPGLLPGIPQPAGHAFRVERIAGVELFSLISARPDDRIGTRFPDGSSDDYRLANDQDHTDFLAQIRSGQAARIENRFLMDFVIRYMADSLAPFWQAAAPEPVDHASFEDRVDNKAERFVYRLRLIDPAGHISAGGALVPRIFRVPSKRQPAAPRIVSARGNGDLVTVRLEADDAFDLAGELIFAHSLDATQPLESGLLDKAQLLRIPNLGGPYTNDGIRVRLHDGSLLAPQFVNRNAAQVDGRRLRFAADVAAGNGKRVLIWAASLTRDGIPSLLIGAKSAVTPPAPPAVPVLAVAISAGNDRATWPAAHLDVSLAVERSTDGGANWRRVSPWLPPDVTERLIENPPAAPRLYRLRLRAPGGFEATGAAVAPA